jgi:hypothetical protein
MSPPRPPNGCTNRRVDSDVRGRHVVANCGLEEGRLVLGRTSSVLNNIRFHFTSATAVGRERMMVMVIVMMLMKLLLRQILD